MFLEGKTLSEAIEKKKLFIVNHKILDGLSDIQNNNKVKLISHCLIIFKMPLIYDSDLRFVFT